MQLDGQGAALFGGRWNSVGKPLIYTAEHRSLAVLEYRVNNPLPLTDLIMLTLEVPENSTISVVQHQLPKDWKAYTFESICAPLGDRWLDEQKSLLLRVPSAIVPEEFNVLLNPLHPMMAEVKVADALPFVID